MRLCLNSKTIDLVSKRLEPQPGTVEGCGLLGVANPPFQVIELEEPGNMKSWSWSPEAGRFFGKGLFTNDVITRGGGGG